MGLLLLLLGASGLVALWMLPLPDRLHTEPSSILRWRDAQPAHVRLAPDDRWRMPARLDELDPDYVEALIAFEDARFWYHPGVDPLALLRAAVDNARQGRVVSGASTLSMQLVRVLEPRPRTLRSKAIEALLALQLELRLSKQEILEAYATFAPYGGNLEGVSTASWAYFGHGPEALSAAEIAILLAVPQRPAERMPGAGPPSVLREARAQVAARLAEEGLLFEPEDLAALASQPVPTGRRPFPRELPHLAAWTQSQATEREQITTLDRNSQAIATRVAASHRRGLQRLGIHHVALVVLDHRSGELRGLVGGHDFFDAHPGSQIPAFAVPRSVGSTLKPWLYALAIDRGLALPAQLVPDLPTSFGGYTPHNYEPGHAGLIPLERALQRSLNVPFVYLLKDLGVESVIGSLELAGATQLVSTPGHYGLSAAVGGLELSPLELASISAVIARGGSYAPLRWRPPDQALEASDLQLLSPGASWLTGRALRSLDRPDFPSRHKLVRSPPGIAWKTGTSFGHRDAWAVGWDAQHTVVVWLGNLDRQPSSHLSGARVAAPMLFDLLEALQPGRPWEQPAAPEDLAPVQLCALSGHPPGPHCPERRTALALSHRVPARTCPYHVQREVDLRTGEALAPGCRQGRPRQTHIFVDFPPAARRFPDTPRPRLPPPPPLAEGCRRGGGAAPRIVSPADEQVSLLLPGVPPDQQEIPLLADAPADARLSWFVDGRYLGSGGPADRQWWTPAPGRHRVLVHDQRGRSAQSELEVRVRR